MAIDLRIIESLLYQPESPSLDFKLEQYQFEGVDVSQKAELLKDILAFANAWRLSTAYVLIGVREAKVGRSDIVGVQKHLDDANLHQFVNGKTQRPVEFTYLPFPVEGVEIGVLEIPIQDRPTFLTKRFGHLSANSVYVRDGSSTRVAKPDEIAKMGAEQVIGGVPQFDLHWADPDNQGVLPSPHTVHSLVLDPQLPAQTFAPRNTRLLGSDPFYNRDYSPGIIACVAERALMTGLGVRLRNNSGVPGRRIRFVGSIRKTNGLIIRDYIEDLPSAKIGIFIPRFDELSFQGNDATDLTIREHDNFWEIDIDFGDVRPMDDVWTSDIIYVGSTNATVVKLEGKLKGDYMPDPVKCELIIEFDVMRKSMDVEDVRPYLDE